MAEGPRIVLREKDPEPNNWPNPPKYLAGFFIYNPLRDDVFNLQIVCVPDRCIDGQWLIWEGKKLWNGYTSIQQVIGVVSRRDGIEQKTYELARKIAEERAKAETYGWYNDKQGVSFIDETSKAKDSLLVVMTR